MGLVLVYSKKKARAIERGALVMYPGQAVLVNFRAESIQNPIFNGHTLVRTIPVSTKSIIVQFRNRRMGVQWKHIIRGDIGINASRMAVTGAMLRASR